MCKLWQTVELIPMAFFQLSLTEGTISFHHLVFSPNYTHYLLTFVIRNS